MSKNNNNYLYVTVKRLEPNDFCLFNYTAFDFQKSVFSISKSCDILCTSNTCFTHSAEIASSASILFSVVKQAPGFQICLPQTDQNSTIWKVVKKNTAFPKGHKLRTGDWIKLGKHQLLVKEINSESLNSFQNLSSSLNSRNLITQDSHSTPSALCRICLTDLCSLEDPLISPCKCTGSIQKIHISCLQKWVKSRIAARTSAKVFRVHLTDVTCELCKTEFPLKITHKNTEFSLINFSFRGAESYALVEEFSYDKKNKLALNLVALNQGESLTVGRGLQADLKIDEMSLSRNHCKIGVFNNEFYIEDLNSKFGTLVELGQEFDIDEKLVNLQVGRSAVKFIKKTRFSLRVCCRVDQRKTGIFYEKNSPVLDKTFSSVQIIHPELL